MTAEREADRPAIGSDNGRPDLPIGGQAKLPGGGQRDCSV
jgi:hypothetical protein